LCFDEDWRYSCLGAPNENGTATSEHRVQTRTGFKRTPRTNEHRVQASAAPTKSAHVFDLKV
jgi:hypothetical protein